MLTCCAASELLLVPDSPTVSTGVFFSAMELVSAASLMWRRSLPAVAILTVASVLSNFAAGPHSNVSYTAVVSALIGFYTLGRHRVQHPALIVGGGFLASLAANLFHIRRSR